MYTDSGYKRIENNVKGFSASNTVFIDQEPYKALRNPVKFVNVIIVILFSNLVIAPNFN